MAFNETPAEARGLWPLQYQDLEKHHSCSYVLLLISNEGSCAFFKHCPDMQNFQNQFRHKVLSFWTLHCRDQLENLESKEQMEKL